MVFRTKLEPSNQFQASLTGGSSKNPDSAGSHGPGLASGVTTPRPLAHPLVRAIARPGRQSLLDTGRSEAAGWPQPLPRPGRQSLLSTGRSETAGRPRPLGCSLARGRPGRQSMLGNDGTEAAGRPCSQTHGGMSSRGLFRRFGCKLAGISSSLLIFTNRARAQRYSAYR
ncbi:unnamed protein product [Meganyctiphanes norvegica]|uniref:Uncharacterized protein n=1 Tax=Meganyctiphanes norvegica TaxID=48144 RepID=A0AAV2RJX2_MEGNR